MAEITQVVFKHTEVVEALIRYHGLHEGIWGLYVRFGLSAGNVGPTDAEILPAAIVPLVELGLQRFEQENNIAIDAAKVNPAQLPLTEKKVKSG